MPFAETIRRYLGWCPMTAPLQNGKLGQKAAAMPVSDRDPGPVLQRSVRYLRLAWIVVGLTWLISLAALPYLPEIVLIHWNLIGAAYAFGGKLVDAFSLPVILTVTAIFLTLPPWFASIRISVDRNRDIYSKVILGTASFFLAMQAMILLSSAGMDLPVAVVSPMSFGFIFTGFGSAPPPWTLWNETFWEKTHEKAGPDFVIAGALIVMWSPVAGMWVMSQMQVFLLFTCLFI
ncbi:MAG: DUF1648 domain-containing protein [Methanomicrobiales archaeon]